MNKHRFRFDMEASWELGPGTDLTPESRAHPNRLRVPAPPGGAESLNPARAKGTKAAAPAGKSAPPEDTR